MCDNTLDCHKDIGADESAEDCCDKEALNLDEDNGEYPYRYYFLLHCLT